MAFITVLFVNTNEHEQRTQVLLSKKELSELLDHTQVFLRDQLLASILIEQISGGK